MKISNFTCSKHNFPNYKLSSTVNVYIFDLYFNININWLLIHFIIYNLSPPRKYASWLHIGFTHIWYNNIWAYWKVVGPILYSEKRPEEQLFLKLWYLKHAVEKKSLLDIYIIFLFHLSHSVENVWERYIDP